MTLTDALERPADYATPIMGAVVVLAPALLVAVLGLASLIGRPLSERGSARAVYAATLVAFLATVAVFVGMLIQDNRHVVIGFGDWVHFGHHDNPDGHYHYSVKFVFDRLSVPFVALTLVLCGTIGAFEIGRAHV